MKKNLQKNKQISDLILIQFHSFSNIFPLKRSLKDTKENSTGTSPWGFYQNGPGGLYDIGS